ncbi:MAG: type 4a pilus biogenesis protein PilO [Bryobacteraceae bacterium]
MRRNFSALRGRLKDARVAARTVLGTLLALNVAAALVAFRPWGGSADDLRRERFDLQQQVTQKKKALASTKALAGKVESARQAGDDFMSKYMLDRRTAYSAILAELDKAATEAGIKPRDSQFAVEEVEGSDTLEVMSITAGYEGTYSNLTKFLNQVDRSPRFLILESLQAAPQQQGQTVNVGVKLNVFVRHEDGQ